MKRKLYIVDPSKHITGAFKAAQNEATILRDTFEVILVLPKISTIEKKDLKIFSKVIYLPIYDLRKSISSIILYLPMLMYSGWLLRKYMKKDSCQLLQINDFYLMQGVVAKLFGYKGKIFTWVRIDPTRYGSLFSKYWLKLDYWASDKVVSVSEFIKEKLNNSEKNIVLYDPIIPSSYQKRYHDETDKKKIVFIGNYTFGKGQQHAIEAFSKLSQNYPDVELHFYGGTLNLEKNLEYKHSLIEKVKEYKLDNKVFFHAYTDNVSDILGESYMALNFSESESFSLTCLEASSSGTCVVATKCGGPEEIIVDHKTGFLVNKGDIAEMTEAMDMLLSDPVLNRSFGENGKKHVHDKFSQETFKRSIMQIFGEER